LLKVLCSSLVFMFAKIGRSEARKSGQEEKPSCIQSDLLLFLSSSLHGFKEGLQGGGPVSAVGLSILLPGGGVVG
jgi:hypothetical protein